jgi:hypothetical protein
MQINPLYSNKDKKEFYRTDQKFLEDYLIHFDAIVLSALTPSQRLKKALNNES